MLVKKLQKLKFT